MTNKRKAAREIEEALKQKTGKQPPPRVGKWIRKTPK